LSKRGVFVNPLVEQRKLPAGDPISTDSLTAFEAVRDEASGQLAKRLGASETLAAGSREPADVTQGRAARTITESSRTVEQGRLPAR
jgi:hypothetical protein